MKFAHLPLVVALLVTGSVPVLAFAQAAEDAQTIPSSQPAVGSDSEQVQRLRQQLAAQQAINEQLRDRVRQLEQQLADRGRALAIHPAGLDTNAPPPPIEPATNTSALEEALTSKGLVLLPAGTFRLTPSLAWAHDGSGDLEDNLYLEGLSVEAGLPWGMAAYMSLPWIQRDSPQGRRGGVGDLTVGLGKRLTEDRGRQPSLVAWLDYRQDTGGSSIREPVPIGAGFRSLTARLSALKRIEPVALYANLSLEHPWSSETHFEPADRYGVGLGASLAATPAISFNSGVSFLFHRGDQVPTVTGGIAHLAAVTEGYIELGSEFVLTRHLALSLSAAAGITEDATDLVLSLSLPYRFF